MGIEMLVDERYLRYKDSITPPSEPILAEIEKEALASDVPIIRRDTQEVLRWMMQTLAPRQILEVGTAVGFSAILMELSHPSSCTITTIENYAPRIPIARDNFARAGVSDSITLLEGDAAEILPSLAGTYDFVFMDAAKGQYPIYLPMIKALLHAGSVFVTDNILQDGDLIESHYAIERRDRTIHKRMRQYLRMLTADEDFVTTILPVGDGLAICTMK